MMNRFPVLSAQCSVLSAECWVLCCVKTSTPNSELKYYELLRTHPDSYRDSLLTTTMEDVIKLVTEFADKAHGDQKRKYTPDRYIVHPIRVMNICKRVTNDPCILAAALLHDVIEDTTVTEKDMHVFLQSILSEEDALRTLQLVVDLTDVFTKENYPHLNRKKRKEKELERLMNTSADSQTIKYADIIDNASEIISHDRSFAGVFLRECRNNLMHLDKGNEVLYKEAINTVNKGLGELKKR
jgi:(p)ppGpp synthase/HD superfamily hydrolase